MTALLPALLLALAPPALAEEVEEVEEVEEAPPVEETQGPQPLEVPPFGAPITDPAALDLQTQEVASALRCPTCQGLSVNDSPADGARAMKARIRELVAMGYSQEQIEDYFIDRYGAWVKLEPPQEGRHVAVWALPAAFVLVGVGVVGWRVRSSRADAETGSPEPRAAGAGATAAAPAAEAPADLEDDLAPYRRRILQELGLSEDPVGGTPRGEA